MKRVVAMSLAVSSVITMLTMAFSDEGRAFPDEGRPNPRCWCTFTEQDGTTWPPASGATCNEASQRLAAILLASGLTQSDLIHGDMACDRPRLGGGLFGDPVGGGGHGIIGATGLGGSSN